MDKELTLKLIALAKEVLTNPIKVAEDFEALARSLQPLKGKADERMVDITRGVCVAKLASRDLPEDKANEAQFIVAAVLYTLGYSDGQKSVQEQLSNS